MVAESTAFAKRTKALTTRREALTNVRFTEVLRVPSCFWWFKPLLSLCPCVSVVKRYKGKSKERASGLDCGTGLTLQNFRQQIGLPFHSLQMWNLLSFEIGNRVRLEEFPVLDNDFNRLMIDLRATQRLSQHGRSPGAATHCDQLHSGPEPGLVRGRTGNHVEELAFGAECETQRLGGARHLGFFGACGTKGVRLVVVHQAPAAAFDTA